MSSKSHRLIRMDLAILLTCLVAAAVTAPNVIQSGEKGEIALKTKIVDATIYSAKAHVTRRAEVEVKSGTYSFIFEDLPKLFVESSLQVEGSGSAKARIIGIDLERREKAVAVSPRYEEMNGKLQVLRRRYAELEIKQKALNARKDLTASIGNFSLEKAQDQLARETFSVQDWKGLLDFFEKEKSETEGKLEAVSQELKTLHGEMEWFQSELSVMQIGEDVVKAVVVDCEVTSPGTLMFDISYIVPNANWKPEYTIRYLEQEERIELTYNAKIWQSTGEDWSDVSVLLSTAEPHIGAAPPELQPNYLLLSSMEGRVTGTVVDAASGETLPFANVVIVGAKLGAMTRADGSYQINNVPEGNYRIKAMMMGYKPIEWHIVVYAGRPTVVNFELEEATVGKTREITVEPEYSRVESGIPLKTGVVKTGDELHVRGGRSGEIELAAKPPTVLYLQAEVTSSEFAANLQIGRPVDLETGAEPKRALVVREKLGGKFSLYSVPRLSEYVFVEGSFTNTTGIPLLAGRSEVYVETLPTRNGNPISNFVGRETIEPVAEGQEFTLHLGVDQDIRIRHILEKKERLSKTGKKTAKVRYHYVIKIENFKEGITEVKIMDRIPVSTIEEVKVVDIDIDPKPGEEEENGILAWKIAVAPDEKKDIHLSYTVEYPGDWPESHFNLVE